jgi:hypothetical protein
LAEPISIGPYETTSLLEALNNWGSLQVLAEYNDWCEGEALPVFCSDGYGIKEAQLKPESYIIYPNPTNDRFTVEGANVAKVEVYNLVGQKVCEQQGSKVVNIDAANWHKGIYLVNIIEQNDAVVTKKLVVR